jgi:mRNA interferase MazF
LEKFTGHVTKGDVVVVSYPYTDGSDAKVRPALVIAKTKSNITICVITHNSGREWELVLKDEDFKEGKLDLISFIQPTGLASVSISIVKKRIGSVKDYKLREVIANLKEYLEQPCDNIAPVSKVFERPNYVKQVNKD